MTVKDYLSDNLTPILGLWTGTFAVITGWQEQFEWVVRVGVLALGGLAYLITIYISVKKGRFPKVDLPPSSK